MAKKTNEKEVLSPNLEHKVVETIELLDPKGPKRIEMVKTPRNTYYFRVYWVRLDIPGKVSIVYPNLEEATTKKDKFLKTGHLDSFYMPLKKKNGKK